MCVVRALKRGDNWDYTLSPAEACLVVVSNLMNNNMLKLKCSKAKMIVFSSKQHVDKTENLHIRIGSNYIKASASVNLRLILDST